jgi:hypothetical protein
MIRATSTLLTSYILGAQLTRGSEHNLKVQILSEVFHDYIQILPVTILSSLQNECARKNCSWVHPASCPLSKILSSGVRRPGRDVNIRLNTDHRLRMNEVIPQLVHTPVCRGVWWSKANFTAAKLRADASSAHKLDSKYLSQLLHQADRLGGRT